MSDTIQRVILPISDNEASERRRFVGWLTDNFVYRRNCPYTVPVWELYDLYKETFPTTTWYEEDMNLLLHQMGYLTPRYPTLNIEPNIKHLTTIGADPFVDKLLQIEWDERVLRRLRRISESHNDEVTNVGYVDGIAISPMSLFYATWCVDFRSDVGMRYLSAIDNKAIVGDIKRAYHQFCLVNELPEERWSFLRQFLESKGHTQARGYARGKSGQAYLRHLYVPVVDDGTLITASDRNQLIITTADGDFLSDGTPIDSTDTERCLQIAKQRAQRLSEVLGLTDKPALSIATSQ